MHKQTRFTYFEYQPPVWSDPDRLVANIEVKSSGAHAELWKCLGGKGTPPLLLPWSRISKADVEIFGWAWSIEVGPEDKITFLRDEDWKQAEEIDAFLHHRAERFEWPAGLRDTGLPYERKSNSRRDGPRRHLGFFRLEQQEVEIIATLGHGVKNRDAIPIGPNTKFRGSMRPTSDDLLEVFETQGELVTTRSDTL